jgi:hypothetical protein
MISSAPWGRQGASMTFLTYFLVVAWLPLCVMALVFIIRPSERWPMFGTRGRSALMLLAFIFGIPVVIALIAPASMRVDPDKADSTTTASASHGVLDNPEDYLELSQVKLDKGADGRVLLGGVITSSAEVPLKNPRVECSLSKGAKDAGTVWGVSRRTIPIGGTINLVALDLGRAEGAWNHQVCKITGAQAG